MQIMGRIRRRVEALPALAVDTGLALLLTGVSLYVRLPYPADSPVPEFAGLSAADVVLIVVTTLPVALRRRFPLLVLATVALLELLAAVVADPTIWSPTTGLGLQVALYTVAVYSSRRTSLIALVLVMVGYLAGYLANPPFRVAGPMTMLLSAFVLYVGTWLLGEWQKTRRAYTAELKQRTARLVRERDQGARLAVAEERVRIARELHDVLAHHVSVMGIQAAAARRVLDRHREDVIAALATIEASSRQAMTDLHQLVGLLRQDNEATDNSRGPQPDLGQLPALATAMREAGLAVDLQIEGDPGPLPAAVQLSVYRIVQEALTNTLQHAGPARAQVSIRCHDRTVEIEVVDNGGGPPATRRVGGSGLAGMRERVALHGGRFEAGSRPDGGFRIHAILDGCAS